MSTNEFSDVSHEYEVAYRAHVLAARLFGAFIDAVKFRRDTEGLSQKELADRMAKTEANVSKLVKGPRNWRLSTIAEFSYALDLELEFAFVNRKDRNQIFTDTGSRRRNWTIEKALRTTAGAQSRAMQEVVFRVQSPIKKTKGQLLSQEIGAPIDAIRVYDSHKADKFEYMVADQ